jgi:ATPase subunit of ABC transporter with duplicated ATPase domains
VIEKKESSRQKTLARELEWINTSAKARNQKNQARINSYNNLAPSLRKIGKVM